LSNFGSLALAWSAVDASASCKVRYRDQSVAPFESRIRVPIRAVPT
jgi:hypothetical protein